MAETVQVIPEVKPLEMELDWIYRGPDPPRFESYKRKDKRNLATHRIVGDRYQGKSALGEFIMAKYIGNGSTCYDFFAANDNESLAWLNPNSPYKDKVVLVHGDSINLSCNYETIRMSELDPTNNSGDKLFITCKKFYSSEQEHYESLFAFTDLVSQRDQWDRIDVIFIREAQQYISSRMKTNQARTQKEAAEKFIEFHNEAFHSGMTCTIDSQREVEVSKNLRELGTFTYYKNMGAMEIPRKIWWIAHPRLANFDLDQLRMIDESQFLLMTNKNCVGLGSFDEPPWHIERGAGLMNKLGISISSSDGKDLNEKPKFQSRNLVNHAGRKSQFTDEMDSQILKLSNEGKKSPRIYVEIRAAGYLGTPKTLQNHIRELKLNEEAKSLAQ